MEPAPSSPVSAARPSSRPARRGLALVAVASTLLLLTACLRTSQAQGLAAMNSDRSSNRLRSLAVQVDAQRKAQAWAEKLARENTLYHSNLPDGIHVKWCSIGENVGYGPSIDAIEKAYMGSPGHRANILNSKWNGAGVGYATNGRKVFTVQVFIQTC